ncbi:MAG: hypothetical protein NTV49_04680 [Kiritimatiellaeota bacterium]|nr:hypothetical protein [Kiritimatiellota bacterium]
MKIALIEIGNSHDICLYAQIRFLKSVPHTHVTLICSEGLKEIVNDYDLVDHKHFVKNRLKLSDLCKLRRYLLTEQFTKVIFNTAEGNYVKHLLLLPFPPCMEFIGVLHDSHKLGKSFSQTLISLRIKKYFMLNNYLLQNVAGRSNAKLKIGIMYPIYFPHCKTMPLAKNNDEIWIGIPGQVELKRRDYAGLLRCFEKQTPGKDIKFILLGRSEHEYGDGAYVKGRIAALGLKDNFILWDGFLAAGLFHSYIEKCDYIMPLIHSGHVSFELYRKQISGAYLIAFGYKKMLLMEDSFKLYDDFANNSIFYSLENLAETIRNLKPSNNQQLYSEEKWAFEFQAKNYWALINAA